MQSATLVLILLGITASVGGGSARREPGNDASRERAADLVKQLGDEKFANRERATRELIDIGEPALPSLRKAAAASDPEFGRGASGSCKRFRELLPRGNSSCCRERVGPRALRDGRQTCQG